MLRWFCITLHPRTKSCRQMWLALLCIIQPNCTLHSVCLTSIQLIANEGTPYIFALLTVSKNGIQMNAVEDNCATRDWRTLCSWTLQSNSFLNAVTSIQYGQERSRAGSGLIPYNQSGVRGTNCTFCKTDPTDSSFHWSYQDVQSPHHSYDPWEVT